MADNTSQQQIISDTATDHAPIVAVRSDQNIVKDSDNTKSKATPANSSSLGGSFSAMRAKIESLMKSYSHQPKYSGSFVEDFEGCVEQYDTYCQLFELIEDEKEKRFPIMLTEAAFAHYFRQFSKLGMTYKQLFDAFLSWYTSEEQKKRLLNIRETHL